MPPFYIPKTLVFGRYFSVLMLYNMGVGVKCYRHLG